MSKVNGNDGNNNDLMKGLQAYYKALRTKASGKEPNKPAEIKGENGTVPIVKQNGNKHTEMGDELLTASFYPDVQFSKNINAIKADLAKLAKPAKPGSLEDLQQKQDIVLSGNISQEDVTEALAIIDAMPTTNDNQKVSIGLDTLATYREYPTRFGKLQTPEAGSELQATKDYVLNNIDILDSIVSFA